MMLMQAPSETELLTLWERGLVRHPIDRALLLCAWARPELPPARISFLPLGTVNASLLRLREACFGACISAWIDCENCGQRLELALNTEQLIAGASERDSQIEFEIFSKRFRLPCSRDLATIAGEQDTQSATMKLLKQCCLDQLDESTENLESILPEVETAMETLDPAADINLALACEECGHHWLNNFNIGALLWDEIDVRARAILAEVHCLAQVYGWTEPEILALSPHRRAIYLGMVDT